MRKPTPMPPSDTSPAARPWQIEREARYSMFGPGVSASPSATRANASRWEASGMTRARLRAGHKYGRLDVHRLRPPASVTARRVHAPPPARLEQAQRQRCHAEGQQVVDQPVAEQPGEHVGPRLRRKGTEQDRL